MKIVVFNTLYYPYQIGGAEKSVKTLSEEFFNLGNEVLVITLGEKDNFLSFNFLYTSGHLIPFFIPIFL